MELGEVWLVLLLVITLIKAIEIKDFKHWFENLSHPETDCFDQKKIASKKSLPLLEFTCDCVSENVTLNYEMTNQSGQKLKKLTHNGKVVIVIGKGNFGFKFKKCLKLGMPNLSSVTGYLINDNLEVYFDTVCTKLQSLHFFNYTANVMKKDFLSSFQASVNHIFLSN